MSDTPVARINGKFGPGNPGRPKGSRNKLAENFIQALYNDFDSHGVEAIQRVRADDPSTYVRVIAGLLPKELEIKRPLADLTDDELVNAVTLIRAAIAGNSDEHGNGASPKSGGEPSGELPAIH